MGGAPSGNLAEARGFGKVIWTSLSIEQFRTVAYGVTAMNPTWADGHRQAAEGIVAALDDAQNWIISNPDQSAALAAQLLPSLPTSTLPAILKDSNFAVPARISDASMKAAQSLSNTFQLTNQSVSDELLTRSYTTKYFPT
jgi:ABC-type nitrate/sulfonate/bicarbonate transport system substrate-binding protein